MALPDETLSIVEQWKKKSIEISSESNDSMALLLSKCIETMAVVLNKKSDLNRVERALASLESERLLSLQFDKIKNDEIRSLVYGQVESLHFTLSELSKERNQVKETAEVFIQTDIIPNGLEMPKEAIFNESAIKIEDYWGDEMAIEDEEMPSDDVDTHNADWENIGDRGDDSNIVDGDDRTQSKVPAMNLMTDDEYHFENEYVDEAMLNSKANAILGDEIDMTSSQKRSRKENNSRREIKCIECEYQTTSVGTFVFHLRKTHSTTLGLAGLALRCDCGVESRSNIHAYKCDISNFTLIRTRDGPIQRIKDDENPQCLLCDVFPRTATGYIRHLKVHHKSGLRANGIYLECSCGVKYRNNYANSTHSNECSRREYKLHKLADK